MSIKNLNNRFVRTTFSLRGLSRVFGDPSNISSNTPDGDSISTFSNLVSKIRLSSSNAIEFKSSPEFYGVDYFGYIIDKERLDPDSGHWIRTDEFKIIGANSNGYKDTRIAYGQTYRYRISSVLKVTSKKPKSNLINYDLYTDIQTVQAKQFTDSFIKNQNTISNLDNNLGMISRKSLTGSSGFELQISDSKKLVYVDGEQRIVDTNQNDEIFNRRQLQNLKASDLSTARGDASISDFARSQNSFLQSTNKDSVDYDYYSSYYQSRPSKEWKYVSVFKRVLPPWPVSINVTPDSLKKQIVISWLSPPNPQRDTNGFKLYRRRAFGRKWNLIARLNQHQTVYIDKNVEFDRTYVYALSTIDVHGLESFLSAQIQAELNKNYSRELQEKKLVWLSGGGTRVDEPSSSLKKFPTLTEQVIAKKNIVMTTNTKFDEQKKDYLIKIKSLDTHEVREIILSVQNKPIVV